MPELTNYQKITKLKTLFSSTKRELDRCQKNDHEYTTSQGNGVNSSEAGSFFDAFKEEADAIFNA